MGWLERNLSKLQIDPKGLTEKENTVVITF